MQTSSCCPFLTKLELELAPQQAGNAKNSRAKQHKIAGLGSLTAATGAVYVKRFGKNRPTSLKRFRRATTAHAIVAFAADAAILVPVHRIAAGHHRVLQTEPVGWAAGQ